MCVVKLHRDNAFTWSTEGDISVKGYVFDENNNVLEGKDLILYFEQAIVADKLEHCLKNTNGLFTLIVNSLDGCKIAIDRFRTFPIFYRKKANSYVISDDVDSLFEDDEQKKIDEESASLFSGYGYVTEDKTLLKNVFQVQAAEYVVVGTSITKKFYYEYGSELSQISYSDAKKELNQIITNVISRISKVLNQKQIALPLSGGYDSRLLAVMLKKAGFKNVLCFTFGTKDKNPEVKRAKAVAKALGFKWYFIDYDLINKNGVFEDERFKSFYQYEAQYVSKFAFMQYFAANYLIDVLKIQAGTFIIPGHGGDFFSGSHLRAYMKNYKSKGYVAKDLAYIHFELIKTSSKLLKKVKAKIKNQLNNKSPLYNNIEAWDLRERQAKYIINSCKLWEQFELPYYMPLCDNDFMDFFVKLPFEYRLNQKLYKEVVSEIFEKYDLNFPEDKIVIESSQMQKIKVCIKRTFPFLRKKTDLFQWDYFDFKTTSLLVVQELKKTGNFDKICSMNGILTEWYLLKVKEKIKE